MEVKKLKKLLADKFSVISVDGPIGVGKTTLVKKASEVFGIPCVCDEKGSPDLLKDFYGNRERFAFLTQVHFAVNRHKQWAKILETGEGHCSRRLHAHSRPAVRKAQPKG
ncbi:MAG: deoxynucleoside kinase [Planctomycetota bacterium]|nr:deoxynucleoside kinase [Planctomycetota bacterium]